MYKIYSALVIIYSVNDISFKFLTDLIKINMKDIANDHFKNTKNK